METQCATGKKRNPRNICQLHSTQLKVEEGQSVCIIASYTFFSVQICQAKGAA